MTGYMALLALLLSSHDAGAADALQACAPPEGLEVGGIGFADTRASALEKLGKPTTTASYWSEDDGGMYTGITLIYPQLEVDVDELRGVERVTSTGPDTELPYGLKAGMTIDAVARLLHFVPTGLRSDSSAVLPVCGAFYDTEVRLRFRADKLYSVEISNYGP